MSSIIIGIAGGTGSGKTTLANRIINQFKDQIAVVHHDNYYKSHTNLTYEERTKLNYDHPDSFDTDLMVEDVKKLKSGSEIKCPVYDFTVHNRSDEFIIIQPKPIILVEGLLILSDPSLRELMDIKIFVDTDADIRLIRRIRRDMIERERSLDSILGQYMETVKPMHDLYIEPSKRYADVIIQEGGGNDVAFDMITHRLEAHILSHKA
ncbi:MAG: uridine kinase [Clostridia bacterium]|nr:uridine kinase [Clostridia bacterium]